MAHDTLGDKAIAVTAQSSSFPHREMAEATEVCEKNGIRQVICRTAEMSIPGFRDNPFKRPFETAKVLKKRKVLVPLYYALFRFPCLGLVKKIAGKF